MTLVTAVHVGAYIMLGADSRANFFHPETGDETVVDDYRKVHLTNSGIIAGSGLLDITNPVIEELKEESKQTPAQLSEMMRNRHELIALHLAQVPDERVRLAGARSGWILATRRKGRMALEFYQSERNFEVWPFNISDTCSLMPSDAEMPVLGSAMGTLRDRIKPVRNLKRLSASLDHHIEIMLDFFRHAHDVSRFVGPMVQFGYVTESGEEAVLDELIPLQD